MSDSLEIRLYYFIIICTLYLECTKAGVAKPLKGAKKSPPRCFQVPFQLFELNLLNSVDNFATLDNEVHNYKSWNCV